MVYCLYMEERLFLNPSLNSIRSGFSYFDLVQGNTTPLARGQINTEGSPNIEVLQVADGS